MRRIVAICAVAWCCAAINDASAAPGEVTLAEAKRLGTIGDTESALALLGKLLEATPNDPDALLLKARLLLDVRDWGASLETYDAYLKTNPRGAGRRTAEKIVAQLSPVRNTKLELTVAGGATVYLDSKSIGVFCLAAPSCVRNVLPGDHRLILEKDGHEKLTVPVVFEMNKTLSLQPTLTALSSTLTLEVFPAATKVTIDGNAINTLNVTLAAGSHVLAARLPGHVDVTQSLVVSGGAPVNVKLMMQVAIPVTGLRSNAVIKLDGADTKLVDGQLRVPSDGTSHRYRIVAPDCLPLEAEIPSVLPSGFTINAKQVMTKVRISTAKVPADTEVRIDSNPIAMKSSAVVWDGAPGNRTIDVRVPGRAQVSKTVQLDEDMVLSIESKSPASKTRLWLGVGATATLAVAGGTFGLLALSKQKTYDRRKVASDVKPPELESLQKRGDKFALISDLSFIGAALGAGYVTYVWLSTPKESAAINFQLTPTGASVQGTF
jgi:hypothetical protein